MSLIATALATIMSFIVWSADTGSSFSFTMQEQLYFCVPGAFFGTLLGLSVGSLFTLRRVELVLGVWCFCLLALHVACGVMINVARH